MMSDLVIVTLFLAGFRALIKIKFHFLTVCKLRQDGVHTQVITVFCRRVKSGM